MLSTSFDTNLELLERTNPLLAFQVSNVPLPKKPPFSEALKWSSLRLTDIDIVYVYGIQPHICPSFLNWLKKKEDRQLIFLEDDLEVIRYFLELKESEAIFTHHQVDICFLGENREETLKQLAWQHLFTPYLFASIPSFDENRRSREQVLKASFEEIRQGAELTLSYYKDYGIKTVRNQWSNFLASKSIKKGEHLKNAFKNIPAIVCGAGPSLNSEGEMLKKVADSALIFGAGSAIGALDLLNVPFHFGVVLDPSPPRERFLKRFDCLAPLFYQSALAHELFMHIEGDSFCFDGMGSFPLSDFFFKQVGLSLPFFEAGWNVLNFAVHIATFLGCNPIICVGMDGCVESEEVYARGATHLGETIERQKVDVIPCVDRFGNKVFSRSDFLMGQKWLKAFAITHSDRRFINASSKGLRFDGFEEKRLHLIEKEVFFPKDLKGEIQSACAQVKEIKIPFAKKKQMLEKLFKSVKNCLHQIDTLLTLYEKDFAQEKDFLENRYALPLVELENEDFYEHLLQPVWDVWKYVLLQKNKKNQILFEKEIQKIVFFKKVSQEYLILLDKFFI